MESFNWLPFLDIMAFTVDRIQNDKNILPSFLNFFKMFEIKCWWNKKERGYLKQTVEKLLQDVVIVEKKQLQMWIHWIPLTNK